MHDSLSELETDPAKRLKGAIRWPWFFSARDRAPPGELYFIRRNVGLASPLMTIVSGTSCTLLASMGRNLIEINSSSRERARDKIVTRGSVTDALSIEVTTTGAGRRVILDRVSPRRWCSIRI